MTISPYIQAIVQAISDNNLSIIVGAGFSKNISQLYLSWKELLHDMIVEMFEEERQTWHATDDDLIGKYGIASIQQGINYEYSSSKGLWPLSEQTCHAHFPVFLQEGSDYPPNAHGCISSYIKCLHVSIL